MTVRLGDATASTVDEALGISQRRAMQNAFHALPGVVERFDNTTGRIDVRPVPSRLVGDASASESVKHPIVQDVPVLFPSGGGFRVTFPLVKGDAVMLVFSQRSIADFKTRLTQGTALDESMPEPGVLFRLDDAVAIPGFHGADQFIGDGLALVKPTDESEIQLLSFDSGRQSNLESCIGRPIVTCQSLPEGAQADGAPIGVWTTQFGNAGFTGSNDQFGAEDAGATLTVRNSFLPPDNVLGFSFLPSTDNGQTGRVNHIWGSAATHILRFDNDSFANLEVEYSTSRDVRARVRVRAIGGQTLPSGSVVTLRLLVNLGGVNVFGIAAT